MKTIGKIFLSLSLALLFCWVAPWLYRLITLKAYATPFTLYSCTLHDFTSLDRSDEREFRFIDRSGGVHGDEAQPMFYASILASRGALPDSIEGRKISLEEIDYHSVIASSDPKDVNRTVPPVYLLMESVPERLELKDPEDAMVSRKSGIDIYDMATNTLRADKTAALNAALKARGFVFPARLFAGKPSHRKEYDEGYLVTDAEGKLFQLKQVNDSVTVRHFPAADGIGIDFLMITEFENHATLGYLTGADGCLQFLCPDGRIINTTVPFNPRKEDLLIVGDMFYYTVKVSDDKGERFWALRSSDFAPVDSMSRAYPHQRNLPGISFTSSTDSRVKLRLQQ
ncbi:MAG: DUF4857 domain-containing protein [Bacteroidales bacterium]|nr:DUF4857 domain-containing protein [Bacteroidales bacterium]